LCEDVETWSQLSIYFSLVASLAPFGRQLGHGLTCHQWILKTCIIIFFSLLFHLVVPEHVAPSYNLFDSYVSELFGTEEINFYSEIQNSP
jgi:hypothetical protein